MAGKKIRSRTSANAIPITNLTNRPTTSSPAVNTINNAGTTVTSTTAASTTNINRQKLPDDLASLTKQQLQVECRKRGQKTTGTKIELLQRLGHKMSSKRNAAIVSQTNGNAASPKHNVVTKATTDGASKAHKQKEKEERESLVLWKKPITTLEYFTKELFILLFTYGQKLLQYKKIVALLLIAVLGSIIVVNTAGPHQQLVADIYKKLLWCAYWTGLGILSSVGLGTGLHTFLLYLGPHIAQVTLAAYECGSLNFPQPPYPDEIICPSESGNPMLITIFSIMSKVRLEAMCWGAGTALGELPPYFMARAARLSGIDPDDDDDDMAEFEELQRKRKEDLTFIERGKLFIEDVVQRVGFFGILACASIPNPLFDLAGITCGHFLVRFWTFFGATLIGKAIIKMHIQKLFVIIAFNETLINTALSWLEVIPVIGDKLQVPFRTFLNGQKTKLHSRGTAAGGGVPDKGSVLSAIFEKFVFAMILYFVVSIVNSFAQSYHKRLHKKKPSKMSKD